MTKFYIYRRINNTKSCLIFHDYLITNLRIMTGEKSMNSKFKKVAGILASLLVLCGLYTLFPLTTTSAFPQINQHPLTATNNSSNTVNLQKNISSLPDFTAIVERASPAVVSIMVSGIKNASNEQELPPWMDKNNPLYQFFRQFGFPGGDGNGMEAPPLEGQGSGFLQMAISSPMPTW